MKNRRLTIMFKTFLLLFFIGLIVAAYCDKTSTDQKKNTQKGNLTVATQKKTDATQQIKVFYFYTSYRCHTCIMLERFTKDAIQEAFADVLKDEKLTIETYNIEVKKNEHFIKKYSLITKSVIVSKHINGKEIEWKNLDKIWTLVRNENKFKKYIKDEVQAYLNS